MHRYDDVEFVDHARSPERRSDLGVDRPTQHALAHRDTTVLGAQRLAVLQRAAGNAGVAAVVEEDAGDRVRSVVGSGSGQPLEPRSRAEMEASLGADFSSVRVHTGSSANESTEAVAASAYTVGDDIVFRDGHYDPSSDAGKHTLAHELTHVVQQRQGPVDGTPAGDGIKVSDPSGRFEREAESSADAVMARQPAEITGAGATGVQREPEAEEEMQMQREADDEDEELQTQREEEEDDEEMQMQRESEDEEMVEA